VRVIRTRAWDARCDHVAVADRLDLLDAVAVGDGVEGREQAIEDSHHLARVETTAHRREVDDVDEEDARLVEVIRDGLGLGLKALGDLSGEDVREQVLDA
jgi:hypothetical protein